MEFLTHSERETEDLGAKLAIKLKPGVIIAYRGGLGMGKTAFTRGIAHGLGYPGRVSSPTFTIVQEYIGGRLPLFHFDWYRIRNADELYNLAWEEYQDRGGVCVIEWSEQAPEVLPSDCVFVTISRVNNFNNFNNFNDNLNLNNYNNDNNGADNDNNMDNIRRILVEGMEMD